MPLEKAALESLIEASPDIVVATDARGRVAYYNDGAQENLGYSREEIIGSSVARLYPTLDEARRVMTAMREGGGRVVNFPTTFLTKAHQEFPVAISGVILHDQARREQGTIGFAKDLREIIRKDQLAVLGEIAIGLSHEINNPLEVIANEIELLERSLERHVPPAQLELDRQRLDAVRREIARVEQKLLRVSEMAGAETYRTTQYLGAARMIDLSATPGGGGELAGRRVLVVDDDPGVRETVAEILRGAGARVEVAENGKRALDRVVADHFDAVLSDVVMPEMDGYELFQAIRRESPSTVVVLMTAFYYDRDHVIKRSRLEGLEGVLFKKPIDPARLRATLATLLSQKPATSLG
jgi:PAS domain S-box-containing protein